MPTNEVTAPTKRQSRLAVAPTTSSDSRPTPSTQIEALSGDPNFMTSLARGLAVIQAFSQRKRQLTVSQISNKTGFSRAAVRRCAIPMIADPPLRLSDVADAWEHAR